MKGFELLLGFDDVGLEPARELLVAGRGGCRLSLLELGDLALKLCFPAVKRPIRCSRSRPLFMASFRFSTSSACVRIAAETASSDRKPSGADFEGADCGRGDGLDAGSPALAAPKLLSLKPS